MTSLTINAKRYLKVSAILSLIAGFICAPFIVMIFVTSIAFMILPDGRSQSDFYIGILRFFLLWSIVWLVTVICVKTWIRAIFSQGVSSKMQTFGWILQTIIASLLLIGFITNSGFTGRNLLFVASIATSLLLISVLGLFGQLMQNKAAHTNPLPALSRSLNEDYQP